MEKTKKIRLYPKIAIDLIKKPTRFYAFPLLGGLVRIIMLIPVEIELVMLGFANAFILLINSFAVLFTRRYWGISYDLNVGIMRLNTKALFFFYGLTDTYPGFSLSSMHGITFDINFPKEPERLFAIPLLGGFIRLILIIPFAIYIQVIQYASMLGCIAGSFVVLFTGRYPESIYELAIDATRLNFSSTAYFAGLSDTYPSFKISMNHKVIKIVLIILGILGILAQNGYRVTQTQNKNMQNLQQLEQQNKYPTTISGQYK